MRYDRFWDGDIHYPTEPLHFIQIKYLYGWMPVSQDLLTRCRDSRPSVIILPKEGIELAEEFEALHSSDEEKHKLSEAQERQPDFIAQKRSNKISAPKAFNRWIFASLIITHLGLLSNNSTIYNQQSIPYIVNNNEHWSN